MSGHIPGLKILGLGLFPQALNSKKSVLKEWLDNEGVANPEGSIRPQLIELINKHRPQRKYLLDDLLKNDPLYKNRNIEILRMSIGAQI